MPRSPVTTIVGEPHLRILAFSDAQLVQDFIFSRTNTGTGGMDVTIDGLVAASTYTLTVWSFDSGSPGSRTSDWTANGVTIEDYGFEGRSNTDIERYL